MEKQKVTAGILAGGKSSRMGTNKAFLMVAQEHLIEYLIKCCDGCGEILISVHEKKPYQQLNQTLVVDEQEEYGPLEGIYQLLRSAACEKVLILATDMPGITPEFLNILMEHSGTEDCLIVTSHGKIQPLCGIYSKSVLPVLEEMRQQEEKKPRMLFDKVKTVYFELDHFKIDDSVIENVNTREEYENWKRKFL